MRKVLIIGITGNFGSHVAQAMARKGWSIRTLMRDPQKLPERFRGAEVVPGDVSDLDAVRRAADGVELVVYGANTPYHQWATTAVPWLENVARVAEERGLTIFFPGNVYVFDPADGPEFDEQSPKRPVTAKGRIRQAMEARLQQASERGARVIMMRAGDFIGPHSKSAWLQQLIKPTNTGYALLSPGPRTLPHTWCYLPDLALAVAELAERRQQLPAFAVYHFRGHCVSIEEMAKAIRTATGQEVTVKPFPWWFLKIGAAFSPMLRSVTEMRYLWDVEINLDDARLRATLGGVVPHTELGEALLEAGIVAKH